MRVLGSGLLRQVIPAGPVAVMVVVAVVVMMVMMVVVSSGCFALSSIWKLRQVLLTVSRGKSVSMGVGVLWVALLCAIPCTDQ